MLAEFETLASVQNTKESLYVSIGYLLLFCPVWASLTSRPPSLQATLAARNNATQEIARLSPPAEPSSPAQDMIISHCRDWLAAFDSMAASWDASMAASAQNTRQDLTWREDHEALSAVVREGSHRAQMLLTQFVAPGKGEQLERHAIDDLGVERLVDAMFPKSTAPSWGALVEAQIRGLAAFAGMADGSGL